MVLSRILVIAALSGSCGGQTAVDTPVQNENEPASSSSTRQPTAECAPLGTGGDEALAQARDLDAKVKAGELDKHRSWNHRLTLYRESAKAGNVEGQYGAGSMLFGFWMTTDAPNEENKSDYIEALTYLFTAASRGHKGAREYAPHIAGIIDSGTIPKDLGMPLEEFPTPWLEKALADAQMWLACYPPAD